MKKTLSIILASVIIISSLVAFALPISANQEYVLGAWDVMMPENAKNDSNHPPLSGYYYNEEGFHTYSPDFSFEHWGSERRTFTVVSKEKFDIKNFSMTIVVHDYFNDGSDNWLSFSVWSESNGMAQGNKSGKFGDGWTSLIRPGADGMVNRFESWNQTIGKRSETQVFLPLDDTAINPITFDPVIDEETDDFTITFAITDGVVTVNGTPIGSETDDCIAKRFDDGYAYIAVTLKNQDPTRYTYSPAISIIDVNGEVPYGDDRKEAESLPCLPPAELLEYQWYTGIHELQFVDFQNCSGFTTSDKSLNITTSPNGSDFSLTIMPYNSLTWLIDDEFSYVVFLVKNLCTCDSNGADASQHTLTSLAQVNYYVCDCCEGHEDTVGYCVTPIDENGNHIVTDCYSLFAISPIDRIWSDEYGLSLTFRNECDDSLSFDVIAVGFANDMIHIADSLSQMGLNGDSVRNGEPPVFPNNNVKEEPTVEETTVEESTVEKTTVEETTVEETSVKETTVEETSTKEPQSTEAQDVVTSDTASTLYGCESSSSIGIISIVAIIGSVALIKKKEE